MQADAARAVMCPHGRSVAASFPTILLSRRRLLGAGLLSAALGRSAWADDLPRTAGPYVPTPNVIVERMLELAKVGSQDVVVDLGCGDGRLVRAAVKLYGARGFGVDIDPELVHRSNAEAQREGIAGRAVFYLRDVLEADVREATVVTLYVLPHMMLELRPKLLAELRPGARIVSHDYHFGDWEPDSRWSFDVPEKREAVGFSSTTLYLWIVPAQVGGVWQVEVADAKRAPPLLLNFRQLFQQVSGAARIGTRVADVAHVRLRGDAIEFALDAQANGELQTYRAKVAGTSMEGEMTSGPGVLARPHKWKAVRLRPPKEPFAH